MGPIEAFKKLGYRPNNHYVWSVLKEDGLCLASWDGEIDRKREGTMVFDTRLDAGPADWRDNPEAAARLEELGVARRKFDGRVHMALRRGTPDENDGTAQPWLREGARKGTSWRRDHLYVAGREFVIQLHEA